MGAIEEGSKVILNWTDSLKREPLSLALVLMNMALLGFFWLILSAIAAQREREVRLLYEDKKHVQELLAHCVVPQRQTIAPREQRQAENKPPDDMRPLPKPLDDVVPLPKPKPLGE